VFVYHTKKYFFKEKSIIENNLFEKPLKAQNGFSFEAILKKKLKFSFNLKNIF
jgi:hypothetical protein